MQISWFGFGSMEVRLQPISGADTQVKYKITNNKITPRITNAFFINKILSDRSGDGRKILEFFAQ